jgi:hypothetical protein
MAGATHRGEYPARTRQKKTPQQNKKGNKAQGRQRRHLLELHQVAQGRFHP